MYYWTPEYVLKMPVVRFFAMLEAGRRIEARERLEMCDLFAIPNCDLKFYEGLKEMYKSRVMGPEVFEAPSSPIAQSRNVFKAESTEAKYAVMGLFASVKGYVQ